jgi:hypothetical protein
VTRLALLVVFAAGCTNDDHSIVCHAPEQSSYDCQPIDPATADDRACHGGPGWRSAHGADDAPLTMQDPGLVFPDGCVFHLNECGCCYASGRDFHCSYDHWSEPL